jgi:hypothetical protein
MGFPIGFVAHHIKNDRAWTFAASALLFTCSMIVLAPSTIFLWTGYLNGVARGSSSSYGMILLFVWLLLPGLCIAVVLFTPIRPLTRRERRAGFA